MTPVRAVADLTLKLNSLLLAADARDCLRKQLEEVAGVRPALRYLDRVEARLQQLEVEQLLVEVVRGRQLELVLEFGAEERREDQALF